MTNKKLFLLWMGLVLILNPMNANDSTKVASPFSVSMELTTKYMWRGIEYGTAPVVFPMLSYGYKGFNAFAMGAMGRRNWLQTGSHFSAQNLAFMFGLLESCKLNKVNFGEYIENILTRILCGEEVDASFLPCDYVRHFEDGTDADVTKTSQAVA